MSWPLWRDPRARPPVFWLISKQESEKDPFPDVPWASCLHTCSVPEVAGLGMGRGTGSVRWPHPCLVHGDELPVSGVCWPQGTQSGSGQSLFMGHRGVRIKDSCPSPRDSWSGGTELGRADPGEEVAGTRPTEGYLSVSCCFVLKMGLALQGRPSVGLQTQLLVSEQEELVTWTLMRQSQWLFPTFLAVSLKVAQGDDSQRAHTSVM